MSYCGFYDKEKGSYFHTKFNNFLFSHHIQSANNFARKNKNDDEKEFQLVLSLDEIGSVYSWPRRSGIAATRRTRCRSSNFTLARV
jgi:hypothetical protein